MIDDMDFMIEGVLVNNFFEFTDGWPNKQKKADAKQLDKDMIEAIVKSLALGESDTAIEANIRLNLNVYGFADKTFPIERWLSAAQEKQEDE